MSNVRKEKEDDSFVHEWKSLWEPDLEAIAYNGQTCDPTRVDPKVLQWTKDHCAHMPHFVKIITRHAAHGRPGLVPNNASSLGVPAPFAKEHFRDLDRVVTLEQDDRRRTWRVSFGSVKNYPVWNQGWSRFARDNNLKPGDIGVFVLVRKSWFRVKFFDADGNNICGETSTSTMLNKDSTVICKKEFPSSSSHGHMDEPFASNPETEQHPQTKKRLCTVSTESLSTEQLLEYTLEPYCLPAPAKEQTPTPTCKKRKLQKIREELGNPSETPNLPTEVNIVENPKSNTIGIPPSTKDAPKRGTASRTSLQIPPKPTILHGKSLQFESLNPLAFTFKSRRRTVTPLERQRAREMAIAFAGLVSGHYFVSVMSETHVYRDFHLIIPNDFATALRLPASPTQLKFVDTAGHVWDVYSKRNALNQFALHRKYWALFALQHVLEEGDVCVFALRASPDEEDSTIVRTVVVHIFSVVPIALEDVSSVHAHYEPRLIQAMVQS